MTYILPLFLCSGLAWADKLAESANQRPSDDVNLGHEPRYVGKGGEEWSGVLLDQKGNPLSMTNGCRTRTLFDGCKPSQDTDASSEAMSACQKIGYVLPTREDFQMLAKEFDHVSSEFGFLLTDKGQLEFDKKLGAKGASTFWTSTIYAKKKMSKENTRANFFSTSSRLSDMREVKKTGSTNGAEDYFVGPRDAGFQVICVRKPMA